MPVLRRKSKSKAAKQAAKEAAIAASKPSQQTGSEPAQTPVTNSNKPSKASTSKSGGSAINVPKQDNLIMKDGATRSICLFAF